MDALLEQYRKTKSQQAFADLVARYTGAVYGQCLRQVRDRAAAEDATQAVFVLLAQKAASLPEGTILEGWLFNTARYTCLNVQRMGRRRRKYESAAAETRPEVAEDKGAADAELRESLDAALARLNEKDRRAITLRYYGGKTVAQVAAELGISEDAAKQRVGRAVEKVRRIYQGLGTAPAAAAVVVALEGAYRAPAPTELVARITEGGVPAGVEAILTSARQGAMYGTAKAVVATTVVVIALGGWFGVKYAAGPAAATPAPLPATAPVSTDTPRAALQRFVGAALADDYAGAIAQTVTAIPDDQNLVRAMLRMNMAHDVLRTTWQQRYGDASQYPDLVWLSIGEIAGLMAKLPESASVFDQQGDTAVQHFRATPQEIFGADAARIPELAYQWLRSTPHYRRVDGQWRIDMDRTMRVIVDGVTAAPGEAAVQNRRLVEAIDVQGRVYREMADHLREGRYPTSAEAMQAMQSLTEQALAQYGGQTVATTALPMP